MDFSTRLAQLKVASAEKSLERKAQAAPQGAPVLGGGKEGPAVRPAQDMYANPPTLQETFIGDLNADISDPKLRNAKVGRGTACMASPSVSRPKYPLPPAAAPHPRTPPPVHSGRTRPGGSGRGRHHIWPHLRPCVWGRLCHKQKVGGSWRHTFPLFVTSVYFITF